MTYIIEASSPEEAAEKFKAFLNDNGYYARSLHPYRAADGNIICWREHYKHHNPSVKKEVRPFHLISEGRYVLGEPESIKGKDKPLYNLDLLASYPKAIIFVTEGEWCADILNDFLTKNGAFGQYLAVTSGGASSAKGADWDPLKNRKVIIFRDNDESGKNYLKDVIGKLSSIANNIEIIDVESLELPEGGDVVDWIEANPDASLESFLALPKIAPDFDANVINLSIDKWPDPEPIKHKLRPVPQLPLEMIPEPLRDYIADISYRMQNPPDMAAVTLITMIGSVIGAGCGIRPKCQDDWLIVPNLYGGIIGRPSVVMKSPTMAEALKPLNKLEVIAKKIHDVALQDFEIDITIHNAAKEEIKKNIKKSIKSTKDSSDNIDVIKEQYKALEAPPAPVSRRYRTNDTTIEKLSELLNENPRGLLMIRDELIGLFTAWEKQGHEQDRSYYLETWNGSGNYITDRIGRGTIYTENMCLSIFGGIQPAKLQQYLKDTKLTSDGMFQRFQMMVYPDEPQTWYMIDKAPNISAQSRVYDIVSTLANMDFMRDCGAMQDYEGQIPYLRFINDAQELFYEWLTELEREKVRGAEDSVLVEHLAKYKKLMPALSLIFHLVEVADGGTKGNVTKRSAEYAAAWCDYLEAHARRIYDLADNIDAKAAENLSRHIARGEVDETFSAREIYRRGWSLLNTSESAQAACDILARKGWLIEVETPAAFQQRAKVEYYVNPKTRGFYGQMA